MPEPWPGGRGRPGSRWFCRPDRRLHRDQPPLDDCTRNVRNFAPMGIETVDPFAPPA
jgi:hypothetical protein